MLQYHHACIAELHIRSETFVGSINIMVHPVTRRTEKNINTFLIIHSAADIKMNIAFSVINTVNDKVNHFIIGLIAEIILIKAESTKNQRIT